VGSAGQWSWDLHKLESMSSIPQTVPERAKSALLDPSIMVPPLLWLVSPEADGMTGRRLVATKWQTGGDGKLAAEAATEQAGW
jgi:hypothetical protein